MAIKGCEELKATEFPEADALLLFNCAGRLLALGPLIGEETEGIRSEWDVPIAGMFSNAELAHSINGNLEMPCVYCMHCSNERKIKIRSKCSKHLVRLRDRQLQLIWPILPPEE